MSGLLEQLPPLDFVQALGFLSFVLGVACFYQRDDRRLKIIMIAMQLNNILHFALLGAMTASLSAALAVVRTYVSIHSSSKRIAFIFIAITLVSGAIFSYMLPGGSWQDMLPIIGSSIGTYALFCLQGIKMRLGFLIGACFWLANNLLVGSIGTSLLEITLIVVNLITISRLFVEKKQP